MEEQLEERMLTAQINGVIPKVKLFFSHSSVPISISFASFIYKTV